MFVCTYAYVCVRVCVCAIVYVCDSVWGRGVGAAYWLKFRPIQITPIHFHHFGHLTTTQPPRLYPARISVCIHQPYSFTRSDPLPPPPSLRLDQSSTRACLSGGPHSLGACSWWVSVHARAGRRPTEKIYQSTNNFDVELARLETLTTPTRKRVQIYNTLSNHRIRSIPD